MNAKEKIVDGIEHDLGCLIHQINREQQTRHSCTCSKRADYWAAWDRWKEIISKPKNRTH